MSVLFYKLAHRFGMTPWERLSLLPASKQLLALFDRAESGLQPPFGSALDLGCGTGKWSVKLAARGWDVTGVDVASKAIDSARGRADEAGLDIRFVEGDVTALEAAGVGTGFDLVLDVGTVHGVSLEQREAIGSGVNEVTAPRATLLMYAFAPARRGPLPRGMNLEEIQATYLGWTVIDRIAFDMTDMPESVKKDDPHWYLLRRG